eukprot:scaffold17.g582.t1
MRWCSRRRSRVRVEWQEALLFLHRSFHFSVNGYASDVLERALARHSCLLRDLPSAPWPAGPASAGEQPPGLERLGLGIERLCVHVDGPFSALTLASNESYTLDIAAPTSHLRAASPWGALRGLETFHQLVQRVALDGLPPAAAAALPASAAWEGDAALVQGGGGGGSAPAPAPACSGGACACGRLLQHDRHRHRRRRREGTTLLVLQAAAIADAPRFPHRGLLLDSARHFLPVGVIKTHLDAMAAAKLNVLHWHLTDDQSFPLQLEELPQLSAAGAFAAEAVYSNGDVLEVIEYAMDRGIRVVPEVDMPGHTRSWGGGLPQLLTRCCDAGGRPTGELGPIHPGTPEVYGILWRLIRRASGVGGTRVELRRLFPDTHLHIGGDEVPFDCWRSSPDVQEFMQREGLADFSALEAYFVGRVVNLAAAAARRVIVWQEVFDHGRAALGSHSIVQVWKWWKENATSSSGGDVARVLQATPPQPGCQLAGGAGGGGAPPPSAAWLDELAEVTAAGHRVLLSAPWYINVGSFGGDDWVDHWRADPRGFAAPPEQLALVVGGEACVWGEHVDASNSMSETWPRAAAAAERLWSPAPPAPGDPASAAAEASARRRIGEFRCRLLARGVRASPLASGYCPGELELLLMPCSLVHIAAIVLWSLYTLKTTGAGLPPGPGGALGAAEGLSYLAVLGVVGWSIATKLRTGSGLPAGPGGVLGAVEGVSYLSLQAGL